MMFHSGRRAWMKGLGAAGLLTPLVGSLARAGGAGPAPRLLVFFTPNEVLGPEYWTPTGSGNEFALDAPLPDMLSPLEPFKQDMLMIGGIKMHSSDAENHGGGHTTMGHTLTGRIVEPYGSQNSEYFAGGISVDQHIANALDCEALTLSARDGGSSGNSRLSYLGPSQPVTPTDQPDQAFDDLFADALLPPDELAELRARRLSVLGHVTSDLQRAQSLVSASDRDKIDAHLDEVHKLEQNIANDVTLQCEPTRPEDGDYGSNAMFPTTARRQIDIAVEALACGVTDVASVQLGNSGSSAITPLWPDEGLNISMHLHDLAHTLSPDPTQQNINDRVAVETWFFDQFAYLLGKLRDRPDAGGGSLLDNTVVLWTKHLGRQHRAEDMLYILAGGGGGAIQTGRYIDRQDEPHNNLLVSVCNLMGLDDDSFGDPAFCTGPLTL